MTTGIQWTEETWNPTTGCDRVSPGCDNCYALRWAGRLKAMGQDKYQRDGDPATSGPGFGVSLHAGELFGRLSSWRRPRRVFTGSMADLFHPKAPEAFLAEVFAAMAVHPRHTFQLLTKRPARMRALLEDFGDPNTTTRELLVEAVRGRGGVPHRAWRDGLAAGREPDRRLRSHAVGDWLTTAGGGWPLGNVWLGVSVEDQARADKRLPVLEATPAAIRFVSCEPLLAPVDLGPWLGGEVGLDWVIVGGESGPGARPMALEWVHQLVEQCTAAGVAVFVKQLGSVWTQQAGHGAGHGGDPDRWPADLRIRQFP